MHFTHSHFTAFDSVMVRRRHQTQHTIYEIWMLVLCKHLKIWNANTKCQHILTIIKNNKNFFKKQSMFFLNVSFWQTLKVMLDIESYQMCVRMTCLPAACPTKSLVRLYPLISICQTKATRPTTFLLPWGRGGATERKIGWVWATQHLL